MDQMPPVNVKVDPPAQNLVAPTVSEPENKEPEQKTIDLSGPGVDEPSGVSNIPGFITNAPS